ncbi:unnamed protein product [Eruca vesicaria subsp. sativa]|uniref:CRIB domain-containing protein n=1 Tax=Eruca vesicaria subsp. sativa TaxID=29727 RepID=A0ABC8ITC9_ERUVS|nr:unnamed protein product [Eruca vesicaria subsp. sativa]
MKDRIERYVVLPFSLGCSTQSSVAVVDTHHQHKKRNRYRSLGCSTQASVDVADTNHQHKKPNQLIKKSDANGLFQKEIDNNNYGDNISDKIIRSFKSFSHYFIRYEEEREEGAEEMEIGLPTDVKHLSHIGIDGTMTTFDSSFPFPGFHLAAV